MFFVDFSNNVKTNTLPVLHVSIVHGRALSVGLQAGKALRRLYSLLLHRVGGISVHAFLPLFLTSGTRMLHFFDAKTRCRGTEFVLDLVDCKPSPLSVRRMLPLEARSHEPRSRRSDEAVAILEHVVLCGLSQNRDGGAARAKKDASALHCRVRPGSPSLRNACESLRTSLCACTINH
jgi:hypothetical protein